MMRIQVAKKGTVGKLLSVAVPKCGPCFSWPLKFRILNDETYCCRAMGFVPFIKITITSTEAGR
jgi:hypothetical protein